MTLFQDDGDVQLYLGDAAAQLALLPAGSVHCVISSPPFWGLRDYGTGSWEGGAADCDHLGEPFRTKDAADRQPMKAVCTKCGARRMDQQVGLEQTPDEWCRRLVDVYREARRVLRDDGVMFLEIGDSYASSPTTGGPPSPSLQGTQNQTPAGTGWRRPDGYKPKDLVGQPWLLAFALRADGWYLRSEIIWARPNPMPESVTDRPTKAHSTVFLLSKKPRYFWDADAIREPNAPDYLEPRPAGRRIVANRDPSRRDSDAGTPVGEGGNPRAFNGAGRNVRSVWQIATEPTPFAHFATWPQTLVERMIRAGTSEHGCCTACGAPWVRESDVTYTDAGRGNANGARKGANDDARIGRPYETRKLKTVQTTGWAPSCSCDGAVRPCTVLDPFMGSGTTALVARRLGRRAVGIELNPAYLEIARRRLQQLSLLALDGAEP